MNPRMILIGSVLGVALTSLPIVIAARQPLTFEERVKAQEAIERVYYAHRIWPKENPQPKPPFEEIVPRAVIEAKVTDYLKKCVALDKFWHRPIQPEQLQAEMDRMAAGTKDPAMLWELQEALGNDPYIVAECLARPILAERFIRNWYAYDNRLHAGQKQDIEELRRWLTPANFPRLAPERFHAIKIELDDQQRDMDKSITGSGVLFLEGDSFQRILDEYPEPASISEVVETNESFLIRWSRNKTDHSIEGGFIAVEKVPFSAWFKSVEDDLPTDLPESEGLYSLNLRSPARPFADPTSPDSWKSLFYTLEPRYGHTAVWTGVEMIVWGGNNAVFLNSGGRYNPSTDTWTIIPTGGSCPSARDYHSAVWTGSEMIIWGGWNGTTYFNGGSRYDPLTGSWTPTSVGTNCPTARNYHTATWTGTEMIIWGGWNGTTYYNSGARYLPASDSWTPTSTGSGCPAARAYQTEVWTGTEMLVWGGYNGTTHLNTGGRYAPATDTWQTISAGPDCPSPRRYHRAVWTGAEMIVWGGYNSSSPYYTNTGGRYDPVLDLWAATSTTGDCPPARQYHTAIWTGAEMIIWGGAAGGTAFNTGGRYTPASDSWVATSTGTDCPAARQYQSAIWTNTEMIIWGGGGHNTGGRYDPTMDSWIPTSTGTFSPSTRQSYISVWTGTEMVVWGGTGGTGSLNTGGRYALSTDSWTATSTGPNCPSPRYYVNGAWTGTKMVVWGGTPGSTYLNTGGLYDPTSDTWTPTSTNGNCPSARISHATVWTGTEMIVWGGSNPTNLNTGGKYNPSSDSWAATSTGANCPSARTSHRALWSGTAMIIWGGWNGTSYYNTGGIYTPASDTWASTSTGANCPSARVSSSAVWTGTEMIIWGGSSASAYLNTGGRYTPSSNTWTATSTGTNCPSRRYGHGAIWTGTEMIVWGGYMFDSTSHYYNDGGRYAPFSNSWTATPTDANCPSPRLPYLKWTGQEMIVWDWAPATQSGGIFYPNTPPLSLPVLSTSLGADATFALGAGETLSLNGSMSTDGSNPYTTAPYHDQLDSLVSHEWDLTGDANFATQCATSSSGVDFTGAIPAPLSDSDLAALGITAPGSYAIWLRVTDEVGSRACASSTLLVKLANPGEASRQAVPIDAMQATWNAGAGQVHLTYTPACYTTGHTAYWGDLAHLSSYSWSGSQCVSGSAAIDFIPPAENIFFVVTGNNGVNEGSYGKSSEGIQRLEAIGIGSCDLPLQLSGTCDP